MKVSLRRLVVVSRSARPTWCPKPHAAHAGGVKLGVKLKAANAGGALGGVKMPLAAAVSLTGSSPSLPVAQVSKSVASSVTELTASAAAV